MPPVSVGQHLQSPVRVPHLGMAHLVAEQQPDGIDNRPRKLLDAANGLLEVKGGGVVFAVGNQHQHLLGPLGVGRQFVGRSHHRIVERGAAARFDVSQAIAQLCSHPR